MWIPLLANLALALTGPRLARTLPPRAAVRLLTAALLAVSAGAGFVLAALGLFALAQVPPVAALEHWSPQALRAAQPVPLGVEVAAGVAVLVLMSATLRRAARGGSDLLRAARSCRLLGPDVDGLVVIDDEEPEAYALPGIAGRIVVTTGMFSALRSDERAALLAHEAAHLSGHHHLYVQLAELAGAANPMLARTAQAVRLAVERDADEAAVAEVGDRRLVARAIARAGLATAAARRSRSTRASVAALSAADSHIMQRTKALLAPAPQPRRALAAGFVLLTVLTVTATALAAQQTDDRLDRAEVAGPAVPRQPAAVAETTSTPVQ